MRRRLFFIGLALTIVLLAVGGWTVNAFRPTRRLAWLLEHRPGGATSR
jgi:hypothetical protein